MKSDEMVMQPVDRSDVVCCPASGRQRKEKGQWTIQLLIVICTQIISSTSTHADDPMPDRTPFWVIERGQEEVGFYVFNLADQNEKYEFPNSATVSGVDLMAPVGGRKLVATLRPKEVNVTWGGIKVPEFAKLPAEQRGFELVLEPKTRLMKAGPFVVRCDKGGEVELFRVLGQVVPSEEKKRPGKAFYSVVAESDERTKVVYHPGEKKPKT